VTVKGTTRTPIERGTSIIITSNHRMMVISVHTVSGSEKHRVVTT